MASRVPFLVRGPGISPGTVVNAVTAQVDFAPTVLEMAGLAAPSSVDGISLLTTMKDPTREVTRPAVLIEATDTRSTVDPPLPWLYHGVVKGRWKYVERTLGDKELYDLTVDPFELSNLAGQAAYARTQSELAQQLEELRWCRGAQCL